MKTVTSDPLLMAGKFMSRILQVVIGIAGLAIIIAVPVLLFNSHWLADALAEADSKASLSMIMAAITVVSLIALAVIALSFHFFKLLEQVIDTVSQGEPFSSLNADRLSRMGWIALIFQLASIPIGAIAFYLASNLPSEDIAADFEFSLTGILFAIVLFILARVFRQGAAMRDDLEGTV